MPRVCANVLLELKLSLGKFCSHLRTSLRNVWLTLALEIAQVFLCALDKTKFCVRSDNECSFRALSAIVRLERDSPTFEVASAQCSMRGYLGE